MSEASNIVDLRPTWIPEDTFGARLALVRQRMRWNMREAAEACGLNRSTWPKWECDGMTPRGLDVVCRKISDASGCNYLWLLAGEAAFVDGPTRGPDSPGGLGLKQSSWFADSPGQVIPFRPRRRDVADLPAAA